MLHRQLWNEKCGRIPGKRGKQCRKDKAADNRAAIGAFPARLMAPNLRFLSSPDEISTIIDGSLLDCEYCRNSACDAFRHPAFKLPA